MVTKITPGVLDQDINNTLDHATTRFNEVVTAKDKGAVGDGLNNDDADALKLAADEATATKRPMILGAGTYRSYPIVRELPNGGGGDVGRILLGPGTTFDAAGGVIEIHGNSRGIDPRGTFTAQTTVTAAMTKGTNVIPVTSTAGFAVNGWAMWRLGDMPYDLPETYNWGFGVITAVGSNTVTVNRPINDAFTSDQLASATFNKHLYAVDPILGVDHGNVSFTSDGGGATGYCVKYAVGPRAGIVKGDGVNVGTHIAQYVSGFYVDQIVATNSKKVVGQELNTGAASRYAEATGTIGQLLSYNCEGYAIYAEATCDILINRLHDINPINYTSGARRNVILANGRTKIHVEEALFEGYGGHTAGGNLDGSLITYGKVTVNTNTPMYGLPMPGKECQRLTIVGQGGVEEIYEADNAQWHTIFIDLSAPTTKNYYGPPGVISELKIFTSNDLYPEDLVYLNLLRESDIGGGSNVKSSLERTKFKDIATYAGDVGASLWNHRQSYFRIYVETSPGYSKTGQFIIVKARIIPDSKAVQLVQTDLDVLEYSGRAATGISYRGRTIAKRLDETRSIKDFGAKGDGVTDDTGVIQAAIDLMNSLGGGDILFPPGTYKYSSLTMKPNVSLNGIGKAYRGKGGAVLLCSGYGSTATINFPVGTYDGAIRNFKIQGQADRTASISRGIVCAGGGIEFSNLTFEFFNDEGLWLTSDSISCKVSDCMGLNLGLNRAPTAFRGGLRIGGSDHYIDKVQFGMSQNYTDATSTGPGWQQRTSANLYNAAVMVEGSDCWITNSSGENADIGIYIALNAARNKIIGFRGDQVWGHSALIKGNGNEISSYEHLTVSQHGNGVYSAIRIEGNGNSIDGVFGGSLQRFPTSAPVMCYPSYVIEDTIDTSQNEFRTKIGQRISGTYVNGLVSTREYLGSSYQSPATPHRSTSATPDVNQTSFVVCVHLSDTTITNFLGGVGGKRITVLSKSNSVITISNNATIQTTTGTNKTLTTNRAYDFVYYNGVWSEIG